MDKIIDGIKIKNLNVTTTDLLDDFIINLFGNHLMFKVHVMDTKNLLLAITTFKIDDNGNDIINFDTPAWIHINDDNILDAWTGKLDLFTPIHGININFLHPDLVRDILTLK
jgi:hypothetical protein